jgi:hypothetical protein
MIFRSPLVDRAEPTDEHQEEAAEIISRSVGTPLPPTIRRTMERTLGFDLAPVRIHSGPNAQRATNLLAARAFARGTDVFLPGGAESPGGEGLLAHELAHVGQHLGQRPSAAVSRMPLTLARHSAPEEDEAGHVERTIDRAFGLPNVGNPLSGLQNAMPDLPLARGQQMLQQAGNAVDQVTSAVSNVAQNPGQALANAVGAVAGGGGGGAGDPEQIAEKVYELLERKLLIERERGGFGR